MAIRIEGATRKDYFLIPVSQIVDDEENYRDVGDVTALAASIAANGVEEPLRGIKVEDDQIRIVDGYRRMAAVRQLAEQGTLIDRVPVIIQDRRRQSEHETKLTQLVLNEHRQDARPLEIARAIDHLVRVVGCTEREVAERLGWPRTKLTRHLALLGAAPRIQQALDAGEIGVTAASEILTKHTTRKAQEDALAAARAVSSNGKVTARTTHAQAPKKRARRTIRSRKEIQAILDATANETTARYRGLREALEWVLGGEAVWK
jgi:ParB/RepB/Spo0J family partition protein